MAEVIWSCRGVPFASCEEDPGVARDSILWYCPKCTETWATRLVFGLSWSHTFYTPIYCPWCQVLPNSHWLDLRSIGEITAGITPPASLLLEFLVNSAWDLQDEHAILDDPPSGDDPWPESPPDGGLRLRQDL